MASVIRSGDMNMREVRTYRFLVILSGGMKMRDEHGKVRGVYISGHDFCHTFRWYGNEGRAWKV